MTESTTTLQSVQQLMARELALDIAALDPARPLEELGVDSLSVIECLFQLEDEFDIKISNEGVSIKTVQDIVDVVDRLVSQRASEPAGTGS